MVGTVEYQIPDNVDRVARPVRKHTIPWTSDANGDVNSVKSGFINGTVERVVFEPGSGDDQPTDLYGVTLKDEQGVDILAGQGANLSNANTTHVKPGVALDDGTTTSVDAVSIDDVLELVVTNAGSKKSGTVYLYVR